MNKCKCGCEEYVVKTYKRGHSRRGMKNTPELNEILRKVNTGKTVKKESIQKSLQTKRKKKCR